MKTLDKYILRAFAGIFLGSLVSVTFLFTVLSVLDSITHLMSMEGAAISGIIRFYLLQLPQTIYMSSSVAALLSAMITLGAMNQQQELLAIRAAGISLARTAAPMAAAALVIAAALFILGNTLVPLGNRQFLSAKQVLSESGQDPRERICYVSESAGKNPAIMIIERVDRQTGQAFGITMLRTGDEWVLEQEIMADSAVHAPGKGWLLKQAVVRSFHGQDVPVLESEEEYLVDLADTPKDLLRIQRAPEEMTLFELNDQISRVRRYGLPDTAYRVERQTRFAIPLAALILILMGAPLAIRPVRSSGLAWGILGAIIIGFGYFVIIAEFISLGKGGLIEPWVAAWSANIIFGIAGVAFFTRLRR